MSAIGGFVRHQRTTKKGDEILRKLKVSFSVLLALIGAFAAFAAISFLYNVPVVTASMCGVVVGTIAYSVIRAIPTIDRRVAAVIGAALVVSMITAYNYMSFHVDAGAIMLAGLFFAGIVASLAYGFQNRGFALTGGQGFAGRLSAATMNSSMTSAITRTGRFRL